MVSALLLAVVAIAGFVTLGLSQRSVSRLARDILASERIAPLQGEYLPTEEGEAPLSAEELMLERERADSRPPWKV